MSSAESDVAQEGPQQSDHNGIPVIEMPHQPKIIITPTSTAVNATNNAPAVPRKAQAAPGFPEAPSALYMKDAMAVFQKTAFLSRSFGFVPRVQSRPLTGEWQVWESAVANLPAMQQSGDYNQILTMPLLDSSKLTESKLIRANCLLGAMAHAVKNVGLKDIPDSVMIPWADVSARLGRPTTSWNSFDWFLYNAEVNAQLGTERELLYADPWKLVHPSYYATGGMSENNFILSCLNVEWVAGKSCALVVDAQTAMLRNDIVELRRCCNGLLKVLGELCQAFLTCDPRPTSPTYVDPVGWARAIAQVGTPVVPGEKTISAFLFPSIHVLDAFIGRKDYNTEMGKLAKVDRVWLPTMYREFLDSILEGPSFREYALADETGEFANIYNSILHAYASEDGFLGVHRLHMWGYLEIAMKVGRQGTAGGTSAGGWTSRVWNALGSTEGSQMTRGMNERLESCQLPGHYSFCAVKVIKAEKLENANSYIIDFDVEGKGFLYQTGDRVSIQVPNLESDIEHIIEALEITREEAEATMIPLNPEWEKVLGKEKGLALDDSKSVPLMVLLRHGKLIGPSRECVSNVFSGLYCKHPLGRMAEDYSQQSSLADCIMLASAVSRVTPRHLISKILTILEPLPPRQYSITSAPNGLTLRLLVGMIEYDFDPLSGLRERFDYSNAEKLEGAKSSQHRDKKQYSMEKTNEDEDWSIPNLERRLFLAKYTTNNERASLFWKKEDPSNVDFDLIVQAKRRSWKRRILSSILTAARLMKVLRCNSTLRHQLGTASAFLWGLKPGDNVQMKVISPHNFHLPPNPTTPVVFVALGTGAAPFVGFADQLQRDFEKSGIRREAWLIWGTRTTKELHFWSTWENHIRTGCLDVSVAFSQEDKSLNGADIVEGSRMRIPGLFDSSTADGQSRISRIWRILKEGGKVFACGTPILQVVIHTILNQAFKRMVSITDGYTYFDLHQRTEMLADGFFERMQSEGRVQVDLFDSKLPPTPPVTYSRSEVALHASSESCWVIFRGRVFDITKYLGIHPGGNKILIDKGGRDMTADFNHSHGAANFRVASLLDAYCIGRIETGEDDDKHMKILSDWAIRLLESALEHRSVWRLDVNQFPGEPSSWSDWHEPKYPNGRSALVGKFLSHHEPETYRHLVVPTLGPLLAPVVQNLTQRDLLDKAILSPITELRDQIAFDHCPKLPQHVEPAIAAINAFFDGIVDAGIAVMKSVEASRRQKPLSQRALVETLAAAVEFASSGFLDGYSSLKNVLKEQT